MIDKNTVQRIKDTADIVEVVSDYVHLKRSGANYMGLCPFHNERTPSFHVNKARNFCYCFSCHKGGSPVNFLMEKEGVSYPEALRMLAAKYGIKIEERQLSEDDIEKQTEREAMLAANQWAMEYFKKNLHDTQEGQDIGLAYFYGKRKITYEAVMAFNLGYALESGSAFVAAAKEKGFRMEVLQNLGLIGKSDGGFFYGRYSGRVIFPIQNSAGKVVGFGGRDLKGHAAKYINSPESEIYKKSYQLYGLYQAKNAIGKENECILVEGYLDVIGMWQAGIKNVVASSGTALTDGQIALIKRFTKNVTLIYDGDAPGIKAALKGVDMLLRNEMDVNVLLLPDGDDPDSFAAKHTPEDLREYIRTNKTDVIRFKIQVLMADGDNSPLKRYETTSSVIDSIAQIPDQMKRLFYAQDSSRLLNVAEDVMIKEITKRRYIKEAEKRKTQIRHSSAPPQNQNNQPENQENLSPTIEPAERNANQVRKDNEDHGTFNLKDKTAGEFLKNEVAVYPLLPLEWRVLQYCIRYGFSNFCYEDIETGGTIEQHPLNVFEYVEEELASDSTKFSVPVFEYIFSTIRQMLPEFKEAYEEFTIKMENSKKEKLQEGYAAIAEEFTSMRDIERAERKLQAEVDDWEAVQLNSFAQGYVADTLINHEEEIIRHFTNEAIFERHQLSNIYSREQVVEKEEDKLLTLLPTSLTVWKNGLLDLRIKALFERFRQIVGKGNCEEEQKIQMELNSLMQLRSSIAKEIGDRILSPGKRNNR